MRLTGTEFMLAKAREVEAAQAVERAAADPEGRALVQAILDRKAS